MLKRLPLLLLTVLVAVPVATAASREFRPEPLVLKAADVKLAKKSTLKRADLGQGWTSFASGDPSSGADALGNCPGFDLDLSAFTITGRAQSAFGNAAGASVSSWVNVFRSKAQAAADFTAATTHPLLLGCTRAALEQELAAEAEETLTLEILSLQQFAFPRVGQQTVAYRGVIKVTYNGTSSDVYVDTISLRKGRSQLSVAFINGQEPFRGQATIAKKIAARMP